MSTCWFACCTLCSCLCVCAATVWLGADGLGYADDGEEHLGVDEEEDYESGGGDDGGDTGGVGEEASGVADAVRAAAARGIKAKVGSTSASGQLSLASFGGVGRDATFDMGGAGRQAKGESTCCRVLPLRS